MSIVAILGKATSLGVRLSVVGNVVKMKGSPEAIATIRPDIAAHKSEIMAHLRATTVEAPPIPDDCVGALRDPDGGPYLPWCPHLHPDQLREMQCELLEVVGELAKLERWPDADYDHVAMCIERQPISTLRPDLAYFQERLWSARANAQAQHAAASQPRKRQ